MRIYSLVTVFALALIAAPAVAHADAAVEITLKDGSSYRGELVERIVGDHVTLKLATGEIRTVPWSDMRTDSAAPAPSRKPAIAEERLDVDVVVGGRAAQLERLVVVGAGRGAGIKGYEPVCTTPCTTPTDRVSTYRLAGDGVTPSKDFQVSPGDWELRLRVDPGSSTKRTLGWWTIVMGSIAAATSLTLIAIGSNSPDPELYKSTAFSSTGATTTTTDQAGLASAQADADRLRTTGYVVAGGAAALVVLGIVLVTTSRTSVKTESGKTLALEPRIPRARHLALTPSGVSF